MEYKPVRVRGKFVHDKELLIGPRAMIDETSGMSNVGSLVSDPKKNQGWLVVTPFMLADTGYVCIIPSWPGLPLLRVAGLFCINHFYFVSFQ